MESDDRTRTAIEEYWLAAKRGDFDAEHATYASDAIAPATSHQIPMHTASSVRV